MRTRQAVQTSLPAPPVALLAFSDPSRFPPRGPGMDAYPDRAAWLAARHDWEARHGVTIAAWSEATHNELAARAGTLAELNEALELTMYEPDEGDEWSDPRMMTDAELRELEEAARRGARARRGLAHDAAR